MVIVDDVLFGFAYVLSSDSAFSLLLEYHRNTDGNIQKRADKRRLKPVNFIRILIISKQEIWMVLHIIELQYIIYGVDLYSQTSGC